MGNGGIEDRVRRFLIEDLHYAGPADELTSDHDLIESRVIDSLGIFQIVSFLESEYGVEIDDEDLLPENFGTLGEIARLVESRTSGTD
ncbi:MAG: acyl carrier protein [Actinomycetota bacterium]